MRGVKRCLFLALVFPAALLAGKSAPGAALIAADEAYDHDVQVNGEWAAAFHLALPESETFVPQRVKVLELGEGRSDPPSRRFVPEQAWISCDGTAGVTYGRWRLPKTEYRGFYEAVWDKLQNGSFKVLLRRGGTEARALYSKPGRKGARATCTGQPGLPITAPDIGTDFKFGASHDQTLIWSSAVSPKGDVRVVVSLWDGTRHVPVLIDPAPPLNAR